MTANKLKILMVLKRFHPDTLYGGAEKSAFRLIEALVDGNLDIEVAGAWLEDSWPRSETIQAGGGTVRIARLLHPKIRLIGTFIYNLLLFIKLLKGRNDYDIVHIHFASIEMMTASLARAFGGPPVICKIACAGSAGELSINGGRFFSRVFINALKRIDCFAALSNDIRDELVRLGVGEEKIVLIPNGVKTEIFQPPTEQQRSEARDFLGIQDYTTVLLFAGRLSAQKGLDLLLESIGKLRHLPLTLYIAGKGPELERLVSLVSKMELGDCVKFLGPFDDIERLYHGADIFVLPSREEGLSNALLEAMSSGLKVVATRVSGSSEAVEDGSSGFLADPEDASSLAEAIERAVTGDRGIGKRARRRVIERYSIDTVAGLYVKTYHSLAGKSGKRVRLIPDPAASSPLFIINSYPPMIGGAERLVESVARLLSESGYRNTVITRKAGTAPFLERKGRTGIFRVPVFGPRVLRSAIFRAASFALTMILRSRYDCIHAHSLDSPAVIGSIAAGITGKDLFVTVHNVGKVDGLKNRIGGERVLKKIIGTSRRIISINDDITDELASAGCPEEKIAFIPNGVDTEKFAPLSGEERYRRLMKMGMLGRTIYLFVGNFHGQKGIDTLIKGWRSFIGGNQDSGAILLLAGDGVLMKEAKDLAAKLGINDTVRFLGKRNDIEKYLKLADIFVQPSRWEGLSIALLEALSCGLAVIATPVGGTDEVIADGVNGLLSPVDDENGLATRMEELLGDLSLRKKLGAAGRKTVIDRYSLKLCVERHLACYQGKPVEKDERHDAEKIEKGSGAARERDEQASEQEIELLSGKL